MCIRFPNDRDTDTHLPLPPTPRWPSLDTLVTIGATVCATVALLSKLSGRD